MKRLTICVALAFLLAARFPTHSRQQDEAAWPVKLTDIAKEAGLHYPSVYGGVGKKRFIIEANGCGVAFFDYDNDGWPDIFVLSGTTLQEHSRMEQAYAPGEAPTNRLYRNNHDGTFTDVTDAAGLRRTGWASGVCVGDYDNDGHLDMLVTYYGKNVLYHNRGNGSFEDVTAKSGLETRGTRWGSGCTFVDYDQDGRLDLFVANYVNFDITTAAEPGEGPNCVWKGIPVNCGPLGLPTDTNLLYHNNGDGTFTDVSERSGISKVTGRYAMTATAADFDGDGRQDIYVACDSTASILYHNNGDGTFTDIALKSGVAYDEGGNRQAGMGVAVGDFDSNGLLDILKTNFADDIPSLYRNAGGGRFEDIAAEAGLAVLNSYVEWGVGMPDFDNDGYPDLFYVTGSVYPEVEHFFPGYPERGPRVIFHNRGNGRFAYATGHSGPAAIQLHSSRGAAFGDFDNDGDVDVLVMNMNEPPSLLRNDYAGNNGWRELSLEGTRSNRAAIGATVVVSAGGIRQARVVTSQSSYYSHDDLRLHFGLGGSRVVDSIEIHWPSGQIQTLRNVPARQILKVKEGS